MTQDDDTIVAVSQRLDTFFTARRAEALAFGAESASFAEAAISAVGGGKRLRARFCLSGWGAIAGDEPPSLATEAAAAAIEIFQAAALVHDDIVDHSDTRRGRPAAHRALSMMHRDAGWHGDPDAFGVAAGILLGDLLLSWSDDLFEEGLSTASTSEASAARRIYARMRREVTIGQFLDVAEESAWVGAPDGEHASRALRVASLKSARYSVEQPLLLGAALAGAEGAQSAALSAFGHPVGLAFQLRDDVLGVYGDPAVTGKPAGDDLREGKRTLLVAYARESLQEAERIRFDSLFGRDDLDSSQTAELQRMIADSGARERLEERIITEVATAKEALADAPLDARALDPLMQLAHRATSRQA